MSSIAYVSDPQMLDYHRVNNHSEMSFWRLSSKNFQDFKKGDFVFFLSKDKKFKKANEKGIIGYGTLKSIESLSLDTLWKKYGDLNGYQTKEELKTVISRHKSTKEFPKKITSLYLEEVVFFQHPLHLSEFGIKISDHLESYTYIDDLKTLKIFNKGKEIGFDIWCTSFDETKLSKDSIRVVLYNTVDSLYPVNYTLKDQAKLKKILSEDDGMDFVQEHSDLKYSIVKNELTLKSCLISETYKNELFGYLMLIKKYMIENYMYHLKVKIEVINDFKLEELLNA